MLHFVKFKQKTSHNSVITVDPDSTQECVTYHFCLYKCVFVTSYAKTGVVTGVIAGPVNPVYHRPLAAAAAPFDRIAPLSITHYLHSRPLVVAKWQCKKQWQTSLMLFLVWILCKTTEHVQWNRFLQDLKRMSTWWSV